MQAVHPVFHVSMLKPTHSNIIPECTQLPPPPVEIDGKLEYEISEILDSKINKCWKHCNIVYLVCWTGYEGTDEETLLRVEVLALGCCMEGHLSEVSRGSE